MKHDDVESPRQVQGSGSLSSITPGERALRWRDVSERLGGISKTTIYEMVERWELPPPRRITPRFAGWLETELTAWLRGRPVASREDERLERARARRGQVRRGR